MPSTAAAFASVKLPTALVQQARDAAQPLRRSVAGQVEYWATLGRIVEHSGLTAQEARDAIEGYEAATRKLRLTSSLEHIEAQFAVAEVPNPQADDLLAGFMAAEADGSLAQRVREVVAENRSRAHKLAA